MGGVDTDINLASIPVGTILRRVHAGVDVAVVVPSHTPYTAIDAFHVVGGIYTTLTVGGTVLNPATSPTDAAPPLQRWLWWEQLFPVLQPRSDKHHPDSEQVWTFPAKKSPIDVEAQVSASTAIDLHLGIGVNAIPAPVVLVHLHYWASILHS